MTGTGRGKEAECNKMDLLILVILGKDNPSIEGLDGDSCFWAEETVVDQLHAQLPTSVLPTDIPSPSSVRDENKNTYTGF
jgi:hypothetical protein